MNAARDALRRNVTGRVESGEAEPIVEMPVGTVGCSSQHADDESCATY